MFLWLHSRSLQEGLQNKVRSDASKRIYLCHMKSYQSRIISVIGTSISCWSHKMYRVLQRILILLSLAGQVSTLSCPVSFSQVWCYKENKKQKNMKTWQNFVTKEDLNMYISFHVFLKLMATSPALASTLRENYNMNSWTKVYVVTSRKRTCEKVMFSQATACPWGAHRGES